MQKLAARAEVPIRGPALCGRRRRAREDVQIGAAYRMSRRDVAARPRAPYWVGFNFGDYAAGFFGRSAAAAWEMKRAPRLANCAYAKEPRVVKFYARGRLSL